MRIVVKFSMKIHIIHAKLANYTDRLINFKVK